MLIEVGNSIYDLVIVDVKIHRQTLPERVFSYSTFERIFSYKPVQTLKPAKLSNSEKVLP